MLLKMGNIDKLSCEYLLSWILKCFLKINGKTPFGFKGGRSRSRAMFIFLFFNASMHSGGVYGRLETCASSRSTWLQWVRWGLEALLAGELPFLQSNRISEAQTQLLTLAKDGCKDQFTVIADIIFLLHWQTMDVKINLQSLLTLHSYSCLFF